MKSISIEERNTRMMLGRDCKDWKGLSSSIVGSEVWCSAGAQAVSVLLSKQCQSMCLVCLRLCSYPLRITGIVFLEVYPCRE